MLYENFNPLVHDISKVAELVYEVDFRTYDLFFRDRNKAIEAIRKDLSKTPKSKSLKVIFNEDSDLIGFLRCYTSKKRHPFNLKSLKLYLVDILDYFVLCDIGENDLYLAEIAIDKEFRGQGLGNRVISDVIGYAGSNNFDRVLLDVDFRNEGAKALYEKMGFKVFNKKRVKIGGFERGMYNMELIL